MLRYHYHHESDTPTTTTVTTQIATTTTTVTADWAGKLVSKSSNSTSAESAAAYVGDTTTAISPSWDGASQALSGANSNSNSDSNSNSNSIAAGGLTVSMRNLVRKLLRFMAVHRSDIQLQDWLERRHERTVQSGQSSEATGTEGGQNDFDVESGCADLLWLAQQFSPLSLPKLRVYWYGRLCSVHLALQRYGEAANCKLMEAQAIMGAGQKWPPSPAGVVVAGEPEFEVCKDEYRACDLAGWANLQERDEEVAKRRWVCAGVRGAGCGCVGVGVGVG
jgi:hypothetical protein